MGTNEDLTNLTNLTDDRAVLLVRDAMDRATADLPVLVDLTGPARAQGLRRKARVRAAIGGGVLAVAGLAMAGAVGLPGGDNQGTGGAAGVVGVAAAPPEAAPQPPVHIEPTPGESSMADLPPAERARQENFQNQAVGVLQGLLPETVGTLQRTDLNVRQYRATKDGKTFVVIFSVRPSEQGPKPCLEIKGQTCKKATLPGGLEVNASTMPMGDTITESRLSFHYGNSDVLLYVGAHEASNTSAPVTNDQLLTLAKAPAFLDLVKTADSQPMEQRQTTINGG
ncbi:hypothetical protein ACWDYJ_31440 [Streptomyces sp. NPDC003042]